MSLNVLLIGDIVGKLGRRTVASILPALRKDRSIDVVIANGENTAGGRGLTPGTAQELFRAGIDIITSGNHIWENREVYQILDDESVPLVRPLNYPEGTPGRGIVKVQACNRTEVQVDLQTAEVLQVAYRRSDLIESLHDGSFFHDRVKLWIFLPVALLLLGLWVTGVYLFVLPYLARRRGG